MVRYKLKDICHKITDGSHNPPKGIELSEYLMLSSKNIYDDLITYEDPRYLTKEEFEAENKRTDIQDGDVLLTIVGTVGRCAVYRSKENVNLVLQRSVAVLKPKQDIIIPRYLMYKLISLSNIFQQEARGVAQKGIYLRQLADIQIDVPSLEIQENIIKILDKASELLDKRKEQIEACDKLIKSQFIEMFGDPYSNEKRWELISLDDITTLITYGLTVRPNFVEEGIDLISAREIRSGIVEYESSPKISENDFENLSGKAKPQKNEILFSKTGSIGHCALITSDRKFAVTQNAARIALKLEQVNPVWVLHYLKMDYIQKWCQVEAKGNAVKDFQIQDIKRIPFFKCEIELQNKFAEFVEQVDKLKFEMQQSLIELENNFNSIMQRAFKGELF